MRVYLRGGYFFVSQHLLNHPDIRPPFQQVSGKRVTENVGANLFLYTCRLRVQFHVMKNGYPGYCRSPGAHENKLFMSFPDINLVSVREPVANLLDGHIRYRHQPLFAPFTFDPDKPLVEIELREP